MSRQISVEGSSSSERVKVRRRVAATAAALITATAFGGAVTPAEYNPLKESREEKHARIIDEITESPENIPEGRAVEVDVNEGDSATTIAQRLHSDGNYDELKKSIANQYVDGLLPEGTITVYDGFIEQETMNNQK